MTFSDTLMKTLTERVDAYRKDAGHEHVGTVIDVGDGIAKIDGLSKIGSSEMIDFGNGVIGSALNLEEDAVGAILFGDVAKVKRGDTAKAMGKVLSVPVGEELIGRVVSPLGEPKDGGKPINAAAFYPVEKIAPGVIQRKSVDTPLQTGIICIDGMIPIGRGQRELIIGDRQTGKTAVVVDTIINQKHTQKSDRPVVCIYVAIGQKESKVAKIVSDLEKHGAMEYTIVVSAGASEPAALSYIAPFAGCAMGEYFVDKGMDVLCIYDDLSKHAWAYRCAVRRDAKPIRAMCSTSTPACSSAPCAWTTSLAADR
jgi:F-type H+/Na+-transporting ATPase subunit alpha